MKSKTIESRLGRGVLLVALLGVAQQLVLSAAAQDTAPFATQKNDYEVALKKIDESSVVTLRSLRDQYGSSLAAVARQLQTDGELDPLMEVNREKARFDAGRVIPSETPEGASPHVARLQADYRRAAAQAVIKKSLNIVELTDRYTAGLEALKKDLTRRDKLEDAVAVKGEMDRVHGSAVYTEAQFTLAENGVASQSTPAARPRVRKVVCPSCAGSGKVDGASTPCNRCFNASAADKKLAAACRGKCVSCKGTGRRETFKGGVEGGYTVGCVGCSGSGICRFCAGTGQVAEKAACGQCSGTGKVPAPADQ